MDTIRLKRKKGSKGKPKGTVQAANTSCPKCKTGTLRHRQYDIYDCDNRECGQSYWWNHHTKEFEVMK